jgi:hypothetical protein
MTVTRSIHGQRRCLRFEQTRRSGVPLRVGGSRCRGRCAAVELTQRPQRRSESQGTSSPAGATACELQGGTAQWQQLQCNARSPAACHTQSQLRVVVSSITAMHPTRSVRCGAHCPWATRPITRPRRDPAVASCSVRVAPTAGERRRRGRQRVGRLAGTGGGKALAGPARPSG